MYSTGFNNKYNIEIIFRTRTQLSQKKTYICECGWEISNVNKHFSFVAQTSRTTSIIFH